MPDIDPNIIATASWSAVALVGVFILAAAIKRKWRKEDAATKQRREQYNAYLAALHEWQDYMDSGEIAAAAVVRAEIDRMEKDGWNVAPVLALAVLLAVCGCASRRASPPPEVVTVPLTEHFRIVSPGDTVPDLPPGEARWYIATPTGMKHLLPASAPINRLGGD